MNVNKRFLFILGGRLQTIITSLSANKMSVYTDNTVWYRASGESNTIYNHPTTQYEQFIERYYGRHKGSGKSKSNGDLWRTSNFAWYRRCDVWGGGCSNLTSQWRSFHTKLEQWQMLPIIGSIFVTGIFTRSRNSGGVPGIVSQAAPFAEMKGLVMLQLSSCCRGTQ